MLEVAARNDPKYFGFDDVSVTPVPAVAIAHLVQSANGFELTWNALAGLNYQVQYKTNLAQADWLDFDAVTATNVLATFVDITGAAGSQRFYRLVLP